jgi:hypothetical protein
MKEGLLFVETLKLLRRIGESGNLIVKVEVLKVFHVAVLWAKVAPQSFQFAFRRYHEGFGADLVEDAKLAE